ncbi:MOSC domain-containing protein [Bacillus suaedae]|nr:MOSC domain-containing protein [Bacillus suaedae]
MKKERAKVNAILLADTPGSFITRRIPMANLEFGGIAGDRHFGVTSLADARQPMYPRGTEKLNLRQITIVSEEELSLIAEELGIEYVLPEWLGANLLVNGYPELTTLMIGSRLLFPDGTGLICMGENKPCNLPGQEIQKHYEMEPKLATRFIRAALKRRGIVCAVECPGKVYEGDEVQIFVNNLDNPMQ